MKPFDLQEYLKNPERKLVTRDNKSVRIICTDRLDSYSYHVVGLIRIGDCDEVCTYTKDGERYTQREDKYDLFFAPEKKEGWINIYHHEGQNSTSSKGIYDTKEEALKYRFKNCVDTIKIEWEE